MRARKRFEEDETEVAHRVCKAAEKYNIPLEINLAQIFNATYYKGKTLNNNPIEVQKERLRNVPYPCKGFWKVVSNYNIRVLYGIDVHHKGQISLFSNLVVLANEIIGMDTISKLKFIANDEEI